ncbi:MAG: AbrB/MazE/SpoVT family DNA-binding domain-containing protein [Verrucomicrobiales bacterium]|jgi:AbrB family looped-hinge helix DNA binding protein|nr:AbrB/MazE/SpoVT family DNA-binding domain-containing protein [Verrucomicrobiales bacterium]
MVAYATITEEGYIAVPSAVRRRTALKPGARFRITFTDNDAVTLEPVRRKNKCRIIKDKLTGLSILDVPKDFPMLTTKRVRELLEEMEQEDVEELRRKGLL